MYQRQEMAWAMIGALFAALIANAQTPDEMARRRKLLDEAQTARDADDHEKALSLAARAGRIHMTPSVRLFIAEEQTAVGQLANSFSNAQLCAAEAKEDKALKNRQIILDACNKLITQLKQQGARLVISMPSPVPTGVQVTVRGHLIPDSLYGQPYFLTPGQATLDASAPDRVPFHRDLVLAAGEEATVHVELPAQAAPVPVAETKEPAPAPSATMATRSEPSTLSRIGPYATMGAGAASLGVSVLFLVLRNNAINKLEAQCTGPDRTVCPDTADARSLRQTASRDNTITNVTLAVGLAAVAGGGAWLLYEKLRRPDEPARAQLRIAPIGSGAMVAVGGAF